MAAWKDKSTGEQLVLLIAFTVCGYVVVVGMTLVFLAIFRPSDSTSNAAKSIAGIINTLIGLLAGFLAGRTELRTRDRDGEG